jgi:hypothetical protein
MLYPNVQPAPEAGRRLYRLVEDYSTIWNGRVIRIPAGFLFDGASIPALAWMLTYTPFHPYIVTAALIHDWIYITHILSRKEADELFKDTALLHHANKIKVEAMYRVLRIAGGMAWPVSKEDLRKFQILYDHLKCRFNIEQFQIPDCLLNECT